MPQLCMLDGAGQNVPRLFFSLSLLFLARQRMNELVRPWDWNLACIRGGHRVEKRGGGVAHSGQVRGARAATADKRGGV